MPGTEEALAPLLLTMSQLAGLLNRSASSLRRDLAEGRLPAPAGGMRKPTRQRGRALYWSRVELQAWISAGQPDRKTWERIRSRHVK